MGQKVVRKETSVYVSWLYYLMKMYGLTPFVTKNGKVSHENPFDIAYTVLLIVLGGVGVVCAYFNLKEIATKHDTSEVQVMRSVTNGVYSLAESAYVFYFFRKSNAVTEIIDMFARMDEIFEKLRVTQNYTKALRVIAVTSTIYMTSLWIIQLQQNIRIQYIWGGSIETYFPLYILTLTLSTQRAIMIGFNVVTYMLAQRLHRTNLILLHVCDRHLSNFDIENGTNEAQIVEHVDDNDEQRDAENHGVTDPCQNQKLFLDYLYITKVQLAVYDTATKITNLFGLPLFAIISFHFTRIVHNCTLIYEKATQEKVVSDADGNALLSFLHIFWLGIVIFELYWTTAASAYIRKQSDTMAVNLRKMWNKHHLQELKDQTFMFTMQLRHTSMDICPYGIALLDFSLLHKIFWAGVSYTVFFIQFRNNKTKSAVVAEI